MAINQAQPVMQAADTIVKAIDRLQKKSTEYKLGDAATKNVANNLTTTDAGKVLDARQGKMLNDSKINTSAIANNLTTASDGYVLDARQGKALSDRISELNAVRQKSYSIPTTGKTILFSGVSIGFVYIQVANSTNQFGLYMYYGSSANCYVREIVGSSYVTVEATTGGLVFTNTSSSARTIRLVAISGYDNLPDS